MPKVLLPIFVWFFVANQLSAQEKFEFQNEIKFATHLIDNYEYGDATLVLKKLSKAQNLNISQFDSVNYLSGWIYYNQKKTRHIFLLPQ